MKKITTTWLAIIGLLLAGLRCQVTALEPNRTKVAEGELVLLGESETGIVSTGKEHWEIRETWTLWQEGSMGYELKGKSRSTSESEDPWGFEYSAKLGPDLHPRSLRVGGLQMVEKGVMTFEFGERELRWRLDREDPQKVEEATLAIQSPYDLYPSFSLWLVASIARRAARKVGQATRVRLVFVDDGDPIYLGAFDASVSYLGEESVEVADHVFQAEKYEVQPDPLPRFLVWLSKEGLILAMQELQKPQNRMELVSYKKYAEFGPRR